MNLIEPLPEGSVIRKLWVNETDAYRDHLLRLDRDSRYRRFSGTVSDDFIARHAEHGERLGVVVHGFFLDGVLRGAAELRRIGSVLQARGRSRLQRRAAVAEPRRRHRAAGAHAAVGPQPRHQVAAHALPGREPSACSSSRANSTPNSPSISAA